MDVFEEIVRIRKAGQRAALATIVHTDGSIPSYEASRMLIRDDGSIAGTVGGGCVEAEVWAAAKEVIQSEQPRKMTFNLNHEPGFDSGLICGGTLEIFVEPILPPPMLYIFGGGHISVALASVDSPLESRTTATLLQTPSASRWLPRFTRLTRQPSRTFGRIRPPIW
jgi:xanthine dehydrogenase accessory factor